MIDAKKCHLSIRFIKYYSSVKPIFFKEATFWVLNATRKTNPKSSMNDMALMIALTFNFRNMGMKIYKF